MPQQGPGCVLVLASAFVKSGCALGKKVACSVIVFIAVLKSADDGPAKLLGNGTIGETRVVCFGGYCVTLGSVRNAVVLGCMEDRQCAVQGAKLVAGCSRERVVTVV